MTVIELPDEQAAALKAQAAAAGLTLEDWLNKLASSEANGQKPEPPSIAHLQRSNPREWARQFRAWADGHDPALPVLSDAAMSRESIYPDLTQDRSLLIDTSTLLRTLQVRHPDHETATRALELLAERGQNLYIVPQNLFELWVVATRPAEQNGLGIPPAAVALELARVKSMFILLPDIPAIYPLWESLVTQHRVIGKPAHDARLVAAMHAHGLTAILTFDQSGFARYPGIEIVHPAVVVSRPAH